MYLAYMFEALTMAFMLKKTLLHLSKPLAGAVVFHVHFMCISYVWS